jgi:hypothetical protein
MREGTKYYLVHFDPDRHAFALAPVAFAPVRAPVFMINTASKDKKKDRQKKSIPPATKITKGYRRFIFSPPASRASFFHAREHASEFVTEHGKAVSSFKRAEASEGGTVSACEAGKHEADVEASLLHFAAGLRHSLETFSHHVAARRAVLRVGSLASC